MSQTFSQFPALRASLLQALTEIGYETPSPIQAEALPVLLENQTDFIGLAATGTGKTAAFALPALNQLDIESTRTQVLVLCPTRELVLQVAGQFEQLGRHLQPTVLAIYGGTEYGPQLQRLRAGVQIIVATPGRLMDHMEKGRIDLSGLTTLILDEADEMISMGFREALDFILAQLPAEGTQRWLFSATMSAPVRQLTSRYLSSPQTVQVNRTEMLSSTVEQYYYACQEKNKPEILAKLIEAADDFHGFVFCQTKALVSNLTSYLRERGFKVDSLHGEMSQSAREKTLSEFRARRLNVLVCTDVAARGLDIKDVSHVVNYSIPRELDNYVHRIGRTARGGKVGLALSLVTPSHRHLLQKIERLTKSRIAEGVIPSRKAIAEKKVSTLLARWQDVKGVERAQELLDSSWRDALTTLSNEEIVSRFIALQFPELFTDERQSMMPREVGHERGPRERDGKSFRGGERRGKPGYKSERYGRPAFKGPRHDRLFKNERFDKPAFAEDRPAKPIVKADRTASSERDAGAEFIPRVERRAKPEHRRFDKPAFKSERPGKSFKSNRFEKPSFKEERFGKPERSSDDRRKSRARLHARTKHEGAGPRASGSVGGGLPPKRRPSI